MREKLDEWEEWGYDRIGLVFSPVQLESTFNDHRLKAGGVTLHGVVSLGIFKLFMMPRCCRVLLKGFIRPGPGRPSPSPLRS